MKKYFCAVLALMMLGVSLLSACSPVVSDRPDCKSVDIFCVGLVTQLGKIDDHGINQQVWEGIQKAKTGSKIEAYPIETVDIKDYDKNIDYFANAGFDVIFTVGSQQNSSTRRVAAAFPNIDFIGVDQQPASGEIIPSNLLYIKYQEDGSGFLAGILAAQVSKSKKIGAVCSTDQVPFVWRYCEGFQAGAIYADPAVDVTVTYHADVSSEKAFKDTEWSIKTTRDMISNGADVIFGVGDAAGQQALITGAENGVYVIGSEDDQYYAITPELRGFVLSSAVKIGSDDVLDVIKSIQENKFEGAKIVSGKFGLAPYHSLEKNISISTKKSLVDALKGLIDLSISTGVSESKP
ncbi:MAG: BMP family ABC transporter substrate-binding protein [Chloroflexota bacterium]